MGARFGVEKVATGCRKLRNFIIHPHGPVFRRPGLEWMGAAATNASATNLRSFQFSASTVFVLDFSTSGLRVWQNGSLVTLLASVSLPYSAAELPAVHMKQVNDVVYLSHPNHEPRRLTRYADNDWRIAVVPWKWPALGDENPAETPTYATLLTSTLAAPGNARQSTWTEAIPSATIGFVGTVAGGPHRLRLEEEITAGVWRTVLDDYSWVDTPSPPAITWNTGAVTNLRRITYQGGGWSPFGVGAYITIGGVSRLLPTNQSATELSATLGMAKVTINSVAQTGSQARNLTLQYRTTVGSGNWLTWKTWATTAAISTIEEFIISQTTEFRWCVDNMADQGGTNTITLAVATSASPAQTALQVSNASVGTGRTLTASRAIFKATHVGAYWQITHRREDAYVQLLTSSAAVAATGVLTFTAISVAAQTVTIGERIYTWRAAVTTIANEVDLGANQAASQANLVAAINGAAGGGTLYGSQTAPHADVTAAVVGSTVVITARTAGIGAHSVVLTDTMSTASWGDVFMSGGVEANTVITAAETAGLRIIGKWDVTTYGSWATTLYLERLTVSGAWEFVRSWRANNDRNIIASGETDGDETLRLRIIAGTASETSTAAAPRFILEAADSRTDGLVKLTAIGTLNGDGLAVTATCDVIQSALNTTPTYVWTEGAFSTARGFPRAVTLHENRLWFAGTALEPLRVWASQTGDIENFRRSSLDDASLSFTPSAGELNPVQWMQSQGSELIIGTLGDEWTITGEGKPITPTNVSYKVQSRYGSAAVAAILAGEVVAFVQRGGRRVRRIGARSDNTPWSTADMTVLSEHVAKNGIVQMAFGSNPGSILWAVTGDGKLLGMTLEVEQNVFGWSVHETDGTIESVAVVYGTDADEVWVSVLRGSARTIERLDPVVFARTFTSYSRMIYLDCAKRVELGAPSATITGLSHLNGKTVTILADGVEHPTCVVSGGSITLASAATTVIVGLPFTSELQPSRVEVQTDKGSAQGKMWRVSRVGTYVHDTRGGQVADSPTSRYEALPYSAAGLYTGDVETVIESNARRAVDVSVKTSAPLPFNLGALMLFLDFYGD